ncbi:hypothetical protein DXG01_010319 [Tephrocybe rancida]|nr:hypothetical protein DXG01_010319 [Tephrocybe rancida]
MSQRQNAVMQVMQFKYTLALLATISAVAALPLDVDDSFQLSRRGTCDAKRCIASLGPTAAACASAGVLGGTHVVADVACVAAIVDKLANVPAPCIGCGKAAKEKAKEVGSAVKTKAVAAKEKTSKATKKVTGGIRAKAVVLGTKAKNALHKQPARTSSMTMNDIDLHPVNCGEAAKDKAKNIGDAADKKKTSGAQKKVGVSTRSFANHPLPTIAPLVLAQW